MKATLNKDKNEITIVMPYDNGADAPKSTSGKSMKRASSGGNQAFSLDGRQVKIGVNAFETVTD